MLWRASEGGRNSPGGKGGRIICLKLAPTIPNFTIKPAQVTSRLQIYKMCCRGRLQRPVSTAESRAEKAAGSRRRSRCRSLLNIIFLSLRFGINFPFTISLQAHFTLCFIIIVMILCCPINYRFQLISHQISLFISLKICTVGQTPNTNRRAAKTYINSLHIHSYAPIAHASLHFIE